MGFGTYGLPGYSLADSIKLIAETGFDSIEIAAMPGYHGHPDEIPKAKRAEIRKQIADSGIQLGALMGIPRPHKDKAAENKEKFQQLLDLAADLSDGDERPLIQSVLGGGSWEDEKELFRDHLGPFVELASKAGIKLAIKPHRGQAMSRPEHGVWIIDQLNATGKLTLVYDYSHFAYRDMGVEETVKIALPHTSYIVVKDAVEKDGKVGFQLPGTAEDLPHVQVLKAFADGGYRGEVCCEVSSMVWRAGGYEPKSATETCYKNLSRIYAKAGIAQTS